jgi:hypothetical protein
MPPKQMELHGQQQERGPRPRLARWWERAEDAACGSVGSLGAKMRARSRKGTQNFGRRIAARRVFRSATAGAAESAGARAKGAGAAEAVAAAQAGPQAAQLSKSRGPNKTKSKTIILYRNPVRWLSLELIG